MRRSIEVIARAVEKRGKHRVGVAFKAEKRLGHSLYRDGKRVVIRWQCLDAEGEVLTEGDTRYGWGGGAGAVVQLPDGTTHARLVFPTPPFEVTGDLKVPFQFEAAR